MSEITVPDKPRGRPPQSYYDQLEQFANDLRKEDSRLDFSMSARGWAYFLENEGEINKSEIDWAQGKINDLRMALLPSLMKHVEDEAVNKAV